MEPRVADGRTSPQESRLRILVCVGTFPIGGEPGASTELHALCGALAEDAEVLVLTPGDGGERPLEHLGAIEVERFPFGSAQRGPRRETDPNATDDLRRLGLSSRQALALVRAQALAIRRIVADRRIDAVHSHGLLLQGVATAAARGRRPRFRHVCTLHGGEPWASVPLRRRLARFVLARTDRMFAVSSDVREGFDALLGAPSQARIQPMGIDTARYRSGALASSPFRDGFLLVVSKLGPDDAVDAALRALARVRERVSDIGLLIVGDGPEATPLIGRVHELGLDDAVQFVGNRPPHAVTALLRAARALVVPSSSHAGDTARLVLSGLAAGTRVVTGDAPGVRGLIDPGHNGWRAESNAPDALAEALIDALETPWPNAIDEKARETADSLDWSRIARAYRDDSRPPSG